MSLRPPLSSGQRTALLRGSFAIGVSALGVAVGAGVVGGTRGVLVGVAVVVAGLVAGSVGTSRRDAVSVLTLLMGVLFLVPENYVLVGPLKSVGNPALLLGLVALVAWGVARLRGNLDPYRGHPIRWTILGVVLSTLTAYAAGGMRLLTDDEAAGSIRSLFPAFAAIGIALLSLDGLADPERLDTLLARIVGFGGIAAFVGILEFFTAFNYRDFARLPGLTVTTEVINASRSGFSRIDGAAAHPIEYAVALAALAPIALHMSLHASSRGRRRMAALALVGILVVNPMTVSRSGLLTLAVGLGFYITELGTRARLNALVLSVLGVAMFRSAVPGLLGTLTGLVTVGNDDPSIAGRTEDYDKIPGLMAGFWPFGRGLGTFQPLQYFYLDNQYLGSLLEGGVVLLISVITLFVVGTSMARGGRARSITPPGRSLGQALAGSVAALGLAAVTFDEFSFHQTSFLAFFLVGCAGAYWTAARRASPALTPAHESVVSRGGRAGAFSKVGR